MSRPKSKIELVNLAEEQYQKLFELISSIPAENLEGTFNFNIEKEKEAHWGRDKNIRDVLAHLYEWHKLLLNWVDHNLNGDAKPFLPDPYTWKTYGDMNIEFFKKHQNTSYNDSIKLLKESHKEAMDLIDKFSDNELFIKSYFSWTGTTNLGSYCISATSSHYDWAIKKIKKYKKELDN